MRPTDRPQSPAAKNPAVTPSAAAAEAFRPPAASLPYAPGAAWIEERTRIAVSRNINVSGKLVFQEPVRIEGNFRGEVSSTDLVVISEEGAVNGRIRTPRILILGELQGDVIGAKSVVLGARSRVQGRIEAETLTVCEGARIEGDLIVGMPARSK
ncbi:MAG: polymer-forming cytoskeletal protein [Candidatus Binataceae bacterium]|nr:polymer-forming cytoskeletal protein [Candidatus Binataceae bacterium]